MDSISINSGDYGDVPSEEGVEDLGQLCVQVRRHQKGTFQLQGV
jgi:hypothetical protein